MWEKEVVGKYRLSYTNKWSSQYPAHLMQSKADDREDDKLVTPKAQKTL